MLRLFRLLRRNVAPTGATVGIGHGRQRGPTQFAGQRLHLDDVSTQARQELRGVGECLHLFDRQHPYALEGPSGRGHRSRRLPQRTPFCILYPNRADSGLAVRPSIAAVACLSAR